MTGREARKSHGPRRSEALRFGRAIVFAAALIAAVAPGPARAEPTLSILPLPFAATEFRGPASRVAGTIASTDAFRSDRSLAREPLVVVWGKGGLAAVALAGSELRVATAKGGSADVATLERGRTTIAGGRNEAVGALSVALEGETRDYPHEALGSPVHAAVLLIAERQASPPSAEPKPVATATSRVPAGPGAVWEDREPRIVDLDGDGTPEILAVRSYRDRGSALAVVGRGEAGWRVLAETPADGEPFRWLNPAASGELGRGFRGVALVRRPHLDGVLQLWRWRDGALTLAAEKAGYSNHAYGRAAQDLAALVQAGADGPLLAVPTLDRSALAFLTLDGSLREVARVSLPARAETGVAALGRGPASHVLVGLEDGRVAVIRP